MSSLKVPHCPELVRAVKQYHLNRANQGTKPWDKQGDLAQVDEITSKIKDISYVQMSVGSFWVTWAKQGVQVLYNETFPDGVVVGVRATDNGSDNKRWCELNGVCFLTGEKKVGEE